MCDLPVFQHAFRLTPTDHSRAACVNHAFGERNGLRLGLRPSIAGQLAGEAPGIPWPKPRDTDA